MTGSLIHTTLVLLPLKADVAHASGHFWAIGGIGLCGLF